ncbi:MAG: hypothetical protein L6R41_000488 [Letrouitia leprolyta]|nr:MAG: hypothetical protein L6R41_000488 [Letrouitia leprolyta]
MAGKRTKEPAPQRSSTKKMNGHPSNGVEPDNASSQEVVTLTPFSIDVYTDASSSNGDTTRPMPGFYAVHIRPESIWASLAKYRNLDSAFNHLKIHPGSQCTDWRSAVRGETYSVHQYAIIARSVQLPKLCNPLHKPDTVDCFARILEIRARDPQNVYARVYWVYRPEHTPSGRQPYHGENELIASNHMEIVDALTFVGRANVVHWVQEDGVQAPAPTEGMYWRQKYDFLSGKISALPTYCVCRKPINLYKFLVQCTNPRCMILLHADCLIEHEHITFLERDLSQRSQPSGTAILHLSQPKDSRSKIKATGIGERYRIDIGDSERKDYVGRTRFMFTDLWEPRNWERDIKCLKCGEKIKKTST